MEKTSAERTNKLVRVVLTGPECTGKSTLSEQLARHFSTVFVPEYAREYIGGLCRPYNYEDVVHIADVQRMQAHDTFEKANTLVFFDTYLIITKVWFNVVFGRHPVWIDKELSAGTIDLYLLCDTTIPWTADPVRENGGEMREKLYYMYKKELDDLGCKYNVITGIGEDRLNHAIDAVNQYVQESRILL